MALAPKLELRQSQQLVMTPQLQQAIKLLQLSNLELQDYVDRQLEENPFLEESEAPLDGPAERRGEDKVENTADHETKEIEFTSTATAADEADTGVGTDEANFDPTREETAEPGSFLINDWSGVSGGARGFDDDDREFGSNVQKEISLKEHLSEQLKVATNDVTKLGIGAYMIDLIDDAGYLREDLAAIAHRLSADMRDVTATHALIQTFDPCGVGARDFKECLRLQLADKNRLDPTMAAFIDNIELLAKGDLKGLMRATNTDEEDVRDMIAEVRSLTPKPGYGYNNDAVQVVVPDVFVKEGDDGLWVVELNSHTLPRVLVNRHYYAKVSTSQSTDADKTFVNEQFANANWLVKSLDQRAQTILNVAKAIVRKQDAFLQYGVKHLRPLNLKTVAEAIKMHESTVSRVTSNKYMRTPRGVFELKYFFTASIASASGGDAHSAEAVRHRIKELIADETRESVLSDDKIVEILQREGIDIARRTVAKYRETLNIPSSVQRRRMMAQSAI